MSADLFPDRIETDRLVMERLAPETVDVFELYAFVSRDDWQGAATEHMPWFRFERVDEVAEFLKAAAQQWRDGGTARYLLRSKEEGDAPDAGGAIIGTTAFGPEWDKKRAGSGIVLAEEYWGQGYGGERAAAFVELTFETYDLDLYYSTCAAGNDPSRRMIEKYVERYGGRHEGLLRGHSGRPDGSVTDQHRFSITREEYEAATANRETLTFDLTW